jgi:hypothetical protein
MITSFRVFWVILTIFTNIEQGALAFSISAMLLSHTCRHRKPDMCVFRYTVEQYDGPSEGSPFDYLSTLRKLRKELSEQPEEQQSTLAYTRPRLVASIKARHITGLPHTRRLHHVRSRHPQSWFSPLYLLPPQHSLPLHRRPVRQHRHPQ